MDVHEEMFSDKWPGINDEIDFQGEMFRIYRTYFSSRCSGMNFRGRFSGIDVYE